MTFWGNTVMGFQSPATTFIMNNGWLRFMRRMEQVRLAGWAVRTLVVLTFLPTLLLLADGCCP